MGYYAFGCERKIDGKIYGNNSISYEATDIDDATRKAISQVPGDAENATLVTPEGRRIEIVKEGKWLVDKSAGNLEKLSQ